MISCSPDGSGHSRFGIANQQGKLPHSPRFKKC
jgi:hypothetical protein